jgi:DNA replication and repair protein RecF
MRLSHLKLAGFRNYRELEFVPGDGINILHGRNAQGKSNVLEAISLLATTRSLRAGRESELIYKAADTAHVSAEIVREREGDVQLQVSVFQGDKKAVRINGLKRARVVDLLGEFNAVFFGSIDIPIVTGEPSTRRHYLNVEISQISPRYVYDFGHYKRILEQRNRLLKDLRDRPRPIQDTGLEAWNEQLVQFGAPIIEKRRFYIERLAPIADLIHQDLTEGNEHLTITYMSSVGLESEAPCVVQEGPGAIYDHEAGDGTDTTVQEAAGKHDHLGKGDVMAAGATKRIAELFQKQLEAVAYDEARRGTTLLGPQRDDVAFLIDGVEARIYGSQGQQRTVALALKLAEFQLIEEFVGEPPVMLLDDVMSDLDDLRRRRLLAWLERRCQSFITCTSLRSFPPEILAGAAKFHVAAGTVTRDVVQNKGTRARSGTGAKAGKANNSAHNGVDTEGSTEVPSGSSSETGVGI